MLEVNIKEGIIENYDGREGVIREINDNNSYMFLKKDTEYDVNVGDEVLFRAEKVEFYPAVPVKIARFVRKRKK